MKEGVGRSGSPIERSRTSFPAASASWRFRSSSAKRYRGKDWSLMLFSSGAAMRRRYRGGERESRRPLGGQDFQLVPERAPYFVRSSNWIIASRPSSWYGSSVRFASGKYRHRRAWGGPSSLFRPS